MFVKWSNSVILHSYNFICSKKRKIVPVPAKAEGYNFSYADVVKMYISMILLLHCRYFILITDNLSHQNTQMKKNLVSGLYLPGAMKYYICLNRRSILESHSTSFIDIIDLSTINIICLRTSSKHI